jgi:hypothetical protein
MHRNHAACIKRRKCTNLAVGPATLIFPACMDEGTVYGTFGRLARGVTATDHCLVTLSAPVLSRQVRIRDPGVTQTQVPARPN